MIWGHYAAALVPHQRDPQTPVAFYLAAANAPDLLWLGLAAAGLETPAPNSLFEASFAALRVDMPYSHDLVTSFGWAVAAALIAFALFRRRAPALWSFTLILVHEACDLLAGFSHWVFGPGTPAVGLNLYNRAPEAALFLEAAFGAACTWWYLRARTRAGRPVAPATAYGLYATFVLGALVWLPIARKSLGAWFG